MQGTIAYFYFYCTYFIAGLINTKPKAFNGASGAPRCGIYASLQQAGATKPRRVKNYLCDLSVLKRFPTMGRAGESKRGGLRY